MAEVVPTHNLGTDMAPEGVMSTQGQKEIMVLASDKEYLDAYFDICRLYQLKRAILYMPKKGCSESKVSKKKAPENDIASINTKIQRQEGIFWQKVEEGQKREVKFAIEEITAKYKLDLFEKRLLLFFLYLEYFAIDTNVCTEDELFCIFDTENSVLSRMRNMRYFRSDSNLIKQMLLCRESKSISGSARMEIALSSRALDIVSTVLSGGECQTTETPKTTRSETIGYVKDPEYKFEDVELTEETKEKVVFFLQTLKDNSLEKLGVSQRIKKGLGTAFLFFGPSGTGKSMLAEAVASYVGKKVLVVEYPKIMDRYVGETDKNITRIFRSAEEEDLVVLLDEADTLFYNRSFAFEEHDIRFVNEMLQELEKFKGIIILTTNMDVLLDPALERRLSLKVKFELPSKELRLKIWQSHIPDKVKIAKGVDFEMLAAKYDFSGGNIKNAVLNAFRKITSRNSDTLTLEDLIFGANLEKDGMYNPKSQRAVVGFSS
ncbi:MAG: ATP-binding protein [Candidatus Omnitrophica bacterium]|nr:ATP-binding protein [Candidatus Omnitrophota bacterium]